MMMTVIMRCEKNVKWVLLPTVIIARSIIPFHHIPIFFKWHPLLKHTSILRVLK